MIVEQLGRVLLHLSFPIPLLVNMCAPPAPIFLLPLVARFVRVPSPAEHCCIRA